MTPPPLCLRVTFFTLCLRVTFFTLCLLGLSISKGSVTSFSSYLEKDVNEPLVFQVQLNILKGKRTHAADGDGGMAVEIFACTFSPLHLVCRNFLGIILSFFFCQVYLACTIPPLPHPHPPPHPQKEKKVTLFGRLVDVTLDTPTWPALTNYS